MFITSAAGTAFYVLTSILQNSPVIDFFQYSAADLFFAVFYAVLYHLSYGTCLAPGSNLQ